MRKELIERLEKCTEPDRELDEAIARFTKWSPTGNGWPPEGAPDWWFRDAFGMPSYTASLDATIALVERMLPEWQVVGITMSWTGAYPLSKERDNRKATAWLRRSVSSYVQVDAEAATPAIALLIALLRALEKVPEPA